MKILPNEYIDQRLQKQEVERITNANEVLEILTQILRGQLKVEIFTATGQKAKKKADINQRQKTTDSLLSVITSIKVIGSCED